MSSTPTAMKWSAPLGLMLAALLLSGCTLGSSEPTPTPQPTAIPTPAGPQTLNVCAGVEPASLYLYGDQSASARTIRAAAYDGPFDVQAYQPTSAIFESLPTLENGGARLETVAVQQGDMVVDAQGAPAPLQPGLRVRPAGCRDGDCVTTYTGGDLQMDQLVVAFTLVPGLTWSDGQPLLASDSVYSFQLDASPETPSPSEKVQFTASYTAWDERGVEWRGLPGYIDPEFARNFWTPLPQHAWEEFSPAELREAPESTRQLLSWGPYEVAEWQPGQTLTLTRNPHYWRASEGLPHFGTVNIHFVGQGPQSNLQAFENGECDLLLTDTGLEAEMERLLDLEAGNQAQLHMGPAGSWVHLDFGIQPLSYDDGLNLISERADFLGTPAVRQAIAQCVDRQAIIDTFAWGRGAVPATYVAPGNPLASGEAQHHSFDPAAANAALDAAGWAAGPDGIRVAQNVENVPVGTPFALRLHVSDDPESATLAQSIQGSLLACGISVEIISDSPDVIFAPGPEGPLFGRDFDLAVFSWPLSEQPACQLYLSEAIPGEDTETYPYSWGGWNLSGWSHPEFDAACQAARAALPGEPAYTAQHVAAQNIFAGELPALPLYLPQQIALARPDFCGFSLEPGANPLQDIEVFGYAEWCD